MRPNGIVVAIDGPSGAGKSTLARMLASRLKYVQIDTGAMYRAAAFLLNRAQVDLADLEAVRRFCATLHIILETSVGMQHVIANGEDLTSKIRSPEMSLITSKISALQPVREAMMREQRDMGRLGGVVLEGRDIGTVVFPDAELKFFLFASPEERGRRRCAELVAKGEQVTLAETIQAVVTRDQQDTDREHAPLVQALDAIAIDSSQLSIEQVLTQMESHFRDIITRIGTT